MGKNRSVECIIQWQGDLPESPDVWSVKWTHYLGYLEGEPDSCLEDAPIRNWRRTHLKSAPPNSGSEPVSREPLTSITDMDNDPK